MLLRRYLRELVIILLVLVSSVVPVFWPAMAQGQGQVQELTGRIDAGEIIFYLLSDLKQGQTLYARMEGISGNLDPLLAVSDPSIDAEMIESVLETALDAAAAEGVDPLEAVDDVRDRLALAWDDDGGGGLAAALTFEVPADGDYRLLTAGALASVGGATFGDFKLMVGLDEPQVLTGEAEPTGHTIAELDVEASPPGAGVQEITGSLTPEKRSTFLELQDFKAGDTFYATIEATSGDLAPILVLRNFADKPIRSGNLSGGETSSLVLPDCGHSPHFDSGEAAFRIMRDFIIDINSRDGLN